MKPIPHRHHAAGKRQIGRRLDRPVTAPSPDPVFTASNIQDDVATKTRAIPCGGIGAIQLLVRKFGLAQAIDERLHGLKFHFPYPESDHVLNFASHALGNGTGRDDIELRRNDLVSRDALGADRIPDPTTAGDFCRRFRPEDVAILQDLFDQTRRKVWPQPPPAFFAEAVLDVDGTLVATDAHCQQGGDIADDGTWGSHPWIISLANTGEVLSLVNHSGSRPSHDGAAEQLARAILRCRGAGVRRLLLRGDTDFTQTTHLDAWDAEGVTFRFGIDAMPNLKAIAEDLPASDWVERRRPPRSVARGKPGTRPEQIQDRIIRERGFATLTRTREAVAEVSSRPTACQESYRLLIVRQTIAVAKGQARLFDEIRWRFYLTNDRTSPRRESVFKAHDRCDQENLMAQLKGGAHALRAAVDNLVSHWASMVRTAWAWNLKAWCALSVPEQPWPQATHREQTRRLLGMEFKRFVNAIILMPCQIVKGGHRLLSRLLSWNEWQGVLLRVVLALRC